MKNIFILLVGLFTFQMSSAQINPTPAPQQAAPGANQAIPSTTGNKNTYDANSNSNYSTQRDIRNVKAQPTNAGNATDIPTNTNTQASGTADAPGTGSNRAAGNISSGNTPVSDPTKTNSTIPENRNNSPRP